LQNENFEVFDQKEEKYYHHEKKIKITFKFQLKNFQGEVNQNKNLV
jgi:hypothetical protein